MTGADPAGETSDGDGLQVAVIGAGMAGLTAARMLDEHGCRVVVVDKGRRPGGRMSSRAYEAMPFDHGCQYFTARDERFRLKVDAWQQAGVVHPWRGIRAAWANGRFSVVTDEVVRYVGVPEMQAVAAYMASGLDVRCGCTVEGLRRAGTRWSLAADPLVREPFDAVVAAVPAPQAARLLPDAVSFRDLLGRVVMEPCWTAMAAYDVDLELGVDAAHVSGSPLVWIARNDSKPGRAGHECWTLQASPGWTRDHLEWSPDQAADALLAEFHRLIQAPGLTPVFVRGHRWRYASPSAGAIEPGALWDPALRIGACGDWCIGSRIEGAFLSGCRMADQLLRERV